MERKGEWVVRKNDWAVVAAALTRLVAHSALRDLVGAEEAAR